MTTDWWRDYGGLLERVARSFAITIRWLPGEIRETVALGYLLARASDSIADSSAADVALRVGALRELEGFAIGAGVVEQLAGLQGVTAEAEVLRALPGLMERMRSSRDRGRLEWVWSRILEGQIFDLERFGVGGGGSAVRLSAEELDRYAYLVAGCVGEFWTELSFDRVPRFSSRAGRGEMVRLGVEYGKGLQRVNILRDRAADQEIGRVYVGDADFARVKDEARVGLEAGLEWARWVERRRMRVACALPARVGLAMWPELRVDAVAGVKISRGRLRGVVLRGLVGLWR